MTRHEEIVIAGLGLAGVGALLALSAANSRTISLPPPPPNPGGEPHQPPPPGLVCGQLGQPCGAGCSCCGLWYDGSNPPKCVLPPKGVIASGPCPPGFTSATTVDSACPPSFTITSCCAPGGSCYLTHLTPCS